MRTRFICSHPPPVSFFNLDVAIHLHLSRFQIFEIQMALACTVFAAKTVLDYVVSSCIVFPAKTIKPKEDERKKNKKNDLVKYTPHLYPFLLIMRLSCIFWYTLVDTLKYTYGGYVTSETKCKPVNGIQVPPWTKGSMNQSEHFKIRQAEKLRRLDPEINTVSLLIGHVIFGLYKTYFRSVFRQNFLRTGTKNDDIDTQTDGLSSLTLFFFLTLTC